MFVLFLPPFQLSKKKQKKKTKKTKKKPIEQTPTIVHLSQNMLLIPKQTL